MLIKARFHFPEVLFGLLLAVAIFAMGATFWSSRQQPSAEQSSASRQQTEKKSGGDGKEAQSLWVPTDFVGLYTLVLCVFTGVLAIVSIFQGVMLLRSDNTARIAANAADLSARAAVAIELPIIRVVPDRFGYGSRQNNDDPRIEYCAIHTLDFSNGGRTRAIPIEVKCGGFIGDKLPDVPAYTFTKSFPIDIVFEPSPAEPSRLYLSDFEITLATGDTDKLMNRNTMLWFYCCVVYLDFMQTRHEAGFCWKRHELFGGGTLLADATPAYNRKI